MTVHSVYLCNVTVLNTDVCLRLMSNGMDCVGNIYFGVIVFFGHTHISFVLKFELKSVCGQIKSVLGVMLGPILQS